MPPLADSGPIALTNSRGTTQSPPFTVAREQNYDLVVSPAALNVFQGASATAQAQLASTGAKPYTGLVTLSVQGLPNGVTASFAPAATLSAFQTGAVTLAAGAAAARGNYSLTVRADAKEGGVIFTRSAAVTLNVLSGVGVTGIKGRFVNPDNVGIGGIIVRADIAAKPQPQTATDAAGNFTLTGLPAGVVTLRFDATPANPLYPIWPYNTTLIANQVTVLADWTIQDPPSADKFSPFTQNSGVVQTITDPRFPGLAITIPAGTTIIGWDGVPKSRIAVERLDPDKLPVTAPPIPTKSVYQLFFGTPMGGLPSKPIPVTLPNDLDLQPGEVTQLWYYDGSPMGGTGEWKVGGTGTVSADGKVIVTNAGSGIPRFCGVCGLPCFVKNQDNDPPPPPPSATGGDGDDDPLDSGPIAQDGSDNDNTDQLSCKADVPQPSDGAGSKVTLAIGQELLKTKDLGIAGLVPIALSRSFHPRDAFNNIAGTTLSLGLGWALKYDVALLPLNSSFTRIVLAGNDQVNFTPDGSGGFQTLADPRFSGAVLRNIGSNAWQLAFKNGRIWRFNQFGLVHLMTERKDTNGNSLLIARASNGKIQSVQGGQRSLSFAYGANGFASQVTDPLGRTVKYTYNAQSRLATVTAPDNGVTAYTYVDDAEFPTTAACPSKPGGVRLKTIQRPGQTQLQTLFYGPGRRVLRETLPNGEENKFSYTVVGACVTHTSTPSVACTVNCPTLDSWDNFQAGWRIWGGVITAAAVVDGIGQSRTQRFDGRKLGSRITDGAGQSTSFARDPASGRVTKISDALGRSSAYSYDAKGNLTRIVDALGRATDLTYDPKWNKVASVTRFQEDNTPVTQTFAYDTNTGNLLTSTDPLANVTTYTYTAQGQLKIATVPGSRTTTFDYNAAGDLVGVTDPLGNAVQFERDAVGRLVALC